MAITNHERVGKALELLRDGLAPFVERELQAALQGSTGSRRRHRATARRPRSTRQGRSRSGTPPPCSS